MKKMPKRYAVLCHRIDCGDETVFQLENEHGVDWWDTKSEARRAMKADFRLMEEDYSPEWSADGKTDPCIRAIGNDEIRLIIPIWNAELEKEDTIQCHWQIVEIT